VPGDSAGTMATKSAAFRKGGTNVATPPIPKRPLRMRLCHEWQQLVRERLANLYGKFWQSTWDVFGAV
jgi:PleD family two-component response regulator